MHVIKQPVADQAGNNPPKTFLKASHGGDDEESSFGTSEQIFGGKIPTTDCAITLLDGLVSFGESFFLPEAVTFFRSAAFNL